MSSRGAEDDARLTGRTCPNLDSAGTGRPVRDHFADFARRRRSGLYFGLGCRRARHVSRGEKGLWSPFHSHNVLTYLSSQHQGQDHHSSPQGKDGLIKRGCPFLLLFFYDDREAISVACVLGWGFCADLSFYDDSPNACACLVGYVKSETSHKTASFLVHWLYLLRTTFVDSPGLTLSQPVSSATAHM